MKVCSANRACYRLNVVAGAFVGALALASNVAHADSYTPTRALTPYKLSVLTDTGEQCLQKIEAASNKAVVAPCSIDTNAQKFYLLTTDTTSLTEFVPQTDAAPDVPITTRQARIVLAIAPDTTGVSKFLAYKEKNDNIGFDPTANKNNIIVWQLERAEKWDYLVPENSPIDTVSSMTRRMRYGALGTWVYKNTDSNFSFQGSCDSYLFGDPYPGQSKDCYRWNGSQDDTPFRVNIIVGQGQQTGACLVATSSSAVTITNDCGNKSAAWRLRPTNYPY